MPTNTFLGIFIIFNPSLLVCGHTYCEICLLKIISKYKNKGLVCPTCQTRFPNIKNEENIKTLIKNFHLLKIVNKIEERNTSFSNNSMRSAIPINESILEKGKILLTIKLSQ